MITSIIYMIGINKRIFAGTKGQIYRKYRRNLVDIKSRTLQSVNQPFDLIIP